MGMYDYVELEPGVELPDFDGDPTDVEWQTKTFPQPCMVVYRITTDGDLLEEDAEYDVVPEEERPHYNEDIGGFEEEWHAAFGMLRKERHGWDRREYHGILEFHGSYDDHLHRFEAKFTDGELEEITRVA